MLVVSSRGRGSVEVEVRASHSGIHIGERIGVASPAPKNKVGNNSNARTTTKPHLIKSFFQYA